jgi:hypothetical protein
MNYAVPGHKYILESPRRLQELEEQRHILLSVFCSEGQCIAKFPNGDFAFPLEMEARFRELVGHKIACIRLDGQFRVRDLESDHA